MSLSQQSFSDLGAPLYEVPFVVLDLETTGVTAAACEITEIGAVRFEGGAETGTFHTLVNPGVAIPPYITVLTGITQAMVVAAPRIGEALPSLLEFLRDAVVVGHNIRFDMSFLQAAAERMGYERLPNRTTDTVALARRLVRSEVRNLRLATLAAHFRSPVTPTHRALDDARATAHVFFELLERAGTVGVTHLEDLLRLPTARGTPHYAKIRLTESLPRRPGVYLFRDRSGEIIYVGKAKNLRTRVRSYFYGDDRRSVAQMLRDLRTIDHRVCATELEAEVAELRLIVAHTPRYNRRSRPNGAPHWVKLTRERYPRLSMVRSYRSGDGCRYLGPFRSRRAAEMVVHAVWDAVPIRRCTGTTRSAACAFAQLGRAVCPCSGEVAEAEYAAVVDRLIHGLDADPRILLDPLAARMRQHARAERFEEAGWLRDRYRALARAIRRRNRWQSLARAGVVWAEDDTGEGVLVDGGRLVAAWRAPDGPPLRPAGTGPEDPAQVPPDAVCAEEARLIWRWLDRDAVRIVASDGSLYLPAVGVPDLVAPAA